MADLAEIGIRVKDNLDAASRRLERFRGEAERVSQRVPQSVQRLNASFNRAAGAVTSLQGALAGLGAGLAINQTIRTFAQFEKQLVAVGKTADIEGQRLDRLGSRIQKIGREVPVATDRLLSLAAAAGQLGVQGVDSIARFTETLAKLELTSDVAGEAGARALARLLNITNTATEKIDRLGSTLTALGNNFAATEQEIIRTSQFLGSATAQFDLTAQQVTGLSAALTALGQRSETSGSAVGAALNEINSAIASGGENLQTLTKLLGQSQSQLREAFGENAVRVLVRFTDSLNDLDNAARRDVLEDFNLAGRETQRIINALAQGNDTVVSALQTANSEWERNVALNREAARVADTFSAQMQIVANTFNEAAVIAGRELAPILLDMATNMRDFLQRTADSGELEAFFERASRAAEGFLSHLQEVLRGFATLSLAIKGAAVGASIGGPIGAAVGGATGGTLGFFSPELISSLASELAKASDNATRFEAAMTEAMTRASGTTRQVISRLKDLGSQIGDITEGIGVNREGGGVNQEKLEAQLSRVNKQLQVTAEAQSAVGRVVQTALDKVGGSIDTAKEAATVQKSLANQSRFLAKAFNEQTGEIEDNTDATGSNNDAKDDVSGTTQQLIEDYAQLRKRIEATTPAIERHNALLNNQVDAVKSLDVDYASLRKRMEATRPAIETLDRAFGNTEKTIEDAEEKTRDLGIQTQSTADIMRGAFEEVGRSIQRGLADAIRGAGTDLLDQAKNIGANLAAAFATQRIVIPAFIQPVEGFLGLNSSSSSATAGQSGVGNIGSLGSLASSIGSGLTTPAIGAQSVAEFAPSVFSSGIGPAPLFSGPSQVVAPAPNALAQGISAASTPLGIGGGLIGGLGASLAFENNLGNTAGSTIGGIGGGIAGGAIAAGTAVGGPIGAGIGALIGAFGGGGLGSLFGGDEPARTARAGINRAGEVQTSFHEASEEQEKLFKQVAQQARQDQQALESAVPGRVTSVPGATLRQIDDQFSVRFTGENRDRGTREFGTDSQQALDFFRRQRLIGANLPDASERVNEFLERSIRRGDSIADTVSQTGRIARLERELPRNQTDRFEQQIEAVREKFRGLISELRDAGQPVQDLINLRREQIEQVREQKAQEENQFRLNLRQTAGKSAKAVNDQIRLVNLRFDNLEEKAETLGVSLELLEKAREAEIEQIKQQRKVSENELRLDLRQTAGLEAKAIQDQIRLVNIRFDDMRERAKQLGISLSLVEKARQAELDKLREQKEELNNTNAALAQVTDRIKNFLQEISGGSESPLSPQDRLEAAREQFQKTLKAARSGDEDAASNLTDVAGNLLDSLEKVFGRGPEFFKGFERVVKVLENILGEDVVPEYASGTNSARQGVALVGERGPEFVNFDGGESVTSNSDITDVMMGIREAIAGDGGSTDAIVETSDRTQELLESILEELSAMREARSSGATMTQAPTRRA